MRARAAGINLAKGPIVLYNDIMINDREKYKRIVRELLRDPRIRKMQGYSQHQTSNSLKHSLHVAMVSFAMAEKMRLRIDEEVLATGAILHDYYLYDIKESGFSDYRHGTKHPQTALDNAMKEFKLTPKEQNIIRSHMWPLTLLHPPKSKEAWIVCMADKFCAAKEMYGRRPDR